MANIWRHHESVPLDVAAIFDPFGNAVHTALSFPVLGEDVLITGAGPIGIMAAAVARGMPGRVTRSSPISIHIGWNWRASWRDAGGGCEPDQAERGAEQLG